LAVPYDAYGQIGSDYAKEFVGKIVLDAGNGRSATHRLAKRQRRK
jgi:predicted dinucleotide-binding enzyme